MIPQEKQPLVARALQQAFGTTEIEDIQQPVGGLSTALVYRIVVKGKSYLLRIITRADAMWDPARHFTCMRAGSDAGIAPRMWYASIEDRILITDFVIAQPFPADIATRMARTIRRLHALPPFAKPHNNYFDAMDGFVKRFRSARLLPESTTEEFFGCYDDVAGVYPHNHADDVACHNDLKPQNILFDGERIQLVDWEAAFLNDRYVDLAVAANFFVTDEAAEKTYLSEYFSETPNEYQRARFYLMRQAMHAFYASFLLVSIASHAAIEADTNAPEFREFHDRLISGEISLVSAKEKELYAKVHLNQLVQNGRTERFKEALAQVAAVHATV
jgi:aminoglycoside phosphotransferase (APT) family kinase protein